jgi:MGT family glycosyltransferase
MLTTVRGSGRVDAYRRIAEACKDLDAQLVISIGKWLEGSEVDSEAPADYPGHPIVVNFAPQWSLIKRSALVVCAGGVNTTMEALSNAVPVLAMPLAASQPGLAARLVRSGAGLMLPGHGATIRQIREAVERLLGESSFRERAEQMRQEIANAGGAARAAEIVEQALLTGKPVRRAPSSGGVIIGNQSGRVESGPIE